VPLWWTPENGLNGVVAAAETSIKASRAKKKNIEKNGRDKWRKSEREKKNI